MSNATAMPTPPRGLYVNTAASVTRQNKPRGWHAADTKPAVGFRFTVGRRARRTWGAGK